MAPPWFFCNLRLPITRLSTQLFSKRPIHTSMYIRFIDKGVSRSLVSQCVGRSLMSQCVGRSLMSQCVGRSLVSQCVGRSLVSQCVGRSLVSQCVARKLFSSVRPVLTDHSERQRWLTSNLVKLIDQCVASKTFSTCTLCRTKNLESTNKLPPPKIDLGKRHKKGGKRKMTTRERNVTALFYLLAAAVGTVGASYAAVPLYRAYCQSSGYGGTVKEGHDTDKVETMVKAEDRLLTIKFNADTASSMRWNFRPQQPVVHVYPGETALAFYTAKNPTAKPIDGISTYNVVPFEAAPYFNKIQCFCFEEQRLNPNEEVDMPVFFYIDPDYVDDPFLENCHEITLSYTFFESKPGLKLPTYMSSSRS